jgi:phage-related protein (TIGR01555 family)
VLKKSKDKKKSKSIARDAKKIKKPAKKIVKKIIAKKPIKKVVKKKIIKKEASRLRKKPEELGLLEKHRALGKLVTSRPQKKMTLNEFVEGHIHRTANQDIVKKPKGYVLDENLQSGLFGPSLGIMQNTVPNSLLNWYGWQTFIGYQTCAIMAQHWLVLKCCTLPARDAIRNGYEITKNDGQELDAKILDAIKKADIRYNLAKSMREFVSKGKIFGFRIAMFLVDSKDTKYYEKPFNPDSVTPGIYKGIVQIDPYWITPELDFDSGANPASRYFYEPTWWRVNAKRIHRTHLVIFRNGELADLLKPTYLYGGIPVPQQIYERVYAAERTANEAPQLAMTKRVSIIKTDAPRYLSNEGEATAAMQQFINFRDNYGTKILDYEDEYDQKDISLSDFAETIMTQYHLVSSATGIPVTKLYGTSAKGLNATGEGDEANYHEDLQSLQEDLKPLVERHHLLLIRSEIAPKFGIDDFETDIQWNALDARTEEEQALINKAKAETGVMFMDRGVIAPEEERKRIINDPLSGYNGIGEEMEGDPDEDPNNPYEKYVQTDPDPNSKLSTTNEYDKDPVNEKKPNAKEKANKQKPTPRKNKV